MNTSSMLICTLALGCLQACAGRSLDLDQGAGSSSNGTDPVGIEATQVPTSIRELDADDTRVYWSTIASSAQSCIFDRCNSTTVSYGPASGPLALGEEDVFFPLNAHDSRLPSGREVECPKTSCLGRPSELLDDPTSSVLFAAVDAQYFYWSSSTDIYRCPLTGCGEFPEVVAKDETTNGGLIVDGDTVFWTFPVDATDPNGESQIHSAPKDGSHPPKLVANGVGLAPYAVVNFAVDATTVYWLDSSSRVQSCPRAGCDGQAPVTLVATDGAKQTLRVDATGLYWLETADLVGDWFSAQSGAVDHVSIRFCALTGCANDAEVRVLTPSKVSQFAMSSKYLYWDEHEVYGNYTYGDSKQIFRLAKPQ